MEGDKLSGTGLRTNFITSYRMALLQKGELVEPGFNKRKEGTDPSPSLSHRSVLGIFPTQSMNAIIMVKKHRL